MKSAVGGTFSETDGRRLSSKTQSIPAEGQVDIFLEVRLTFVRIFLIRKDWSRLQFDRFFHALRFKGYLVNRNVSELILIIPK